MEEGKAVVEEGDGQSGGIAGQVDKLALGHHMLEAAAVPKRPGLAPRTRMAEGLDQGRGVFCAGRGCIKNQESAICQRLNRQPCANQRRWMRPPTAAKGDRRAS